MFKGSASIKAILFFPEKVEVGPMSFLNGKTRMVLTASTGRVAWLPSYFPVSHWQQFQGSCAAAFHEASPPKKNADPPGVFFC